MKKSLCLFLCLVLLWGLFAGCGKEPSPEPEPPTTDAAASTQENPAEPLSFSLDALPDIGAFAPAEKKDCFFSDGPRDTFEPRDDYGEVVPYCLKSEKYFAASWSFTDEETGEVYSGTTEKEEEGYYATYGFATADGKIITEGIYTRVYWEENFRGDGYYVAGRTQAFEMGENTDLIAADGSWCLHLDDGMYSDAMYDRSWSEPPLFMVSSEKEAVLYNYQGEKVLDATPFRDEDMYSVQVCYIDGEKLLVEKNDWQNDKRTYTLFDYDGNKLGQLPPSVSWVKEVYQSGVMIVDIGDDRVQLMDIYGNALSESYYDLKYSAADKCFLAPTNTMPFVTNDGNRVDDAADTSTAPDYESEPSSIAPTTAAAKVPTTKNEIVLLDETGKKQKTLRLSYNTVKGESGYVWLFDEREHTFYDIDGNPTAMDTDGQEIVKVYDYMGGWTGETATFYFYVETANGDLHVFDTDGNKIKTLQDVTFETYEGDEEDPEKYYQIEVENGVLSCQKKESLELTQLSSGKTLTVPIKDGERYGWTTVLNGRIVAVSYRADDGTYRSVYDVYDIETGERLFADAVFTDNFGQYALVATKTESFLLDETATTLIRLQNDELI